MEATEITAASEPVAASRAFLRAALNGGYALWLRYGHGDEITCWVLVVRRASADVQDRESGEIKTIRFDAITEAVEA